MANHSGTRKLVQACAPTGAALALVGILGVVGALSSLDRAWFDFLQRKTAPLAPIPADTALVLIDEKALQRMGAEDYGYRWPWPRRTFAGLFASLHRAGAKAVVADFNFFEASEDAMQDYEFGAIAAALPELTLGAMPADGSKPEQLPVIWPADFREANAAFFRKTRWGSTRSVPDADSVLRRYVPKDSIVAVATQPDAGVTDAAPRLLRWRGNLGTLAARGVPVLTAAPFATDGLAVVRGAGEIAADLEPAALLHAIDVVPASTDALTQEAFAKVRGRTVFVGVNAAGTYDYIATPCGAPEPGVISHWTAYANFVAGGFLRESGPWASVGALALLVVTLGWAARGGIGVLRPALVAGGGAALALGGSAAAFVGNVWFAPMLPVAGAVAGFGAAAVQSFLLERARKQEIQGWFGSYVSPAVVKQLVQNPDSLKLGGEKRELTVFFADLANFTTLSESMPAEELVPLINSVLEDLTEGVLHHGCYVDKYIGDAIMGVFGSPEPLENHAVSACRAALDCLRRLEVLNARIERERGQRLGMRIGVNTGDVIVGNVGSTKKRNYTVLGDPVNLASRLEGANKEFHTAILIGPRTAALVGDALVTRPVAQLKVKGKKQAVEVHELIGEPGGIDEATRRFLAAYRAGYAAFCARRFTEAQRAFGEAATLRPGDFLATRYADESDRLHATPPAAEWEPILELHSK
ncbi:MAG TPA: adenylate/guanylate cyclase domain-containing protein [Opitutaceae bacterium]|nr:adenylate/guanylate cyclase domain-containing protein [Opitutaceae bacterium]